MIILRGMAPCHDRLVQSWESQLALKGNLDSPRGMIVGLAAERLKTGSPPETCGTSAVGSLVMPSTAKP
jgi:hypothetical protein